MSVYHLYRTYFGYVVFIFVKACCFYIKHNKRTVNRFIGRIIGYFFAVVNQIALDAVNNLYLLVVHILFPVVTRSLHRVRKRLYNAVICYGYRLMAPVNSSLY